MNTTTSGLAPQTMRRVIVLFRSYRRRLSIVALIVIVTAGLGVVNPLLIKPVFDNALFCGQGCPNLPLLFWYVGVMIAVPIVTAVLGVAQNYLANVLGQRVIRICATTSTPIYSACPCGFSPRQRPAKSSPASPTTSAAYRALSPKPPRRSCRTPWRWPAQSSPCSYSPGS